MYLVKAIAIFYQKLIVPVLPLSILIGALTFGMTKEFSLQSVGFSYLFLAPVFHYFVYDVRNPNEYYFYHNLGLSKLNLWIISSGISSLIALLFYSL